MLSKYFYDYFPIGLCLICRKKSSIVLRYNIIFCAIFRRHFCKTPIWSFSNYIIQQKIFFYMIFKIIMKIYLTYTFKLKINYIRKQKYRYNDDNWLLVIKWPKKNTSNNLLMIITTMHSSCSIFLHFQTLSKEWSVFYKYYYVILCCICSNFFIA